jgi:hypothetical protein
MPPTSTVFFTYPNAYPIDAEKAEIDDFSRVRATENKSLGWLP